MANADPFYHEVLSLQSENVRDISMETLKLTVKHLKNEIRHFIQENEIFTNFLTVQEPSMIADMDVILKKAQQIQEQGRASIITLNSVQGSEISLSTKKNVEVISKGPRINLTQKTDLVLREIDDIQITYDNFIKKSKRTKFNLRAEMEELGIRSTEVDTAFKMFEQAVVIDSVNKITQKIPAEKFVRHMQEWLKSAQLITEKLRLRTISFKIQLSRLKAQLIQKEELGGSVDIADLEMLEIQNIHLLKEIKQKNTNLIELKHMGSKAHMFLTAHRKILQRQYHALQNIKLVMEETQRNVDILSNEAEIAENEVEREKRRMDEIKKLIDAYQVPSVMEYIKKKAELRDLQKETKTWQRKEQLLETGLATYTRNMCRLKRMRNPQESWYTLKDTESSVLSSDSSLTQSLSSDSLFDDSIISTLSGFCNALQKR